MSFPKASRQRRLRTIALAQQSGGVARPQNVLPPQPARSRCAFPEAMPPTGTGSSGAGPMPTGFRPSFDGRFTSAISAKSWSSLASQKTGTVSKPASVASRARAIAVAAFSRVYSGPPKSPYLLSRDNCRSAIAQPLDVRRPPRLPRRIARSAHRANPPAAHGVPRSTVAPHGTSFCSPPHWNRTETAARRSPCNPGKAGCCAAQSSWDNTPVPLRLLKASSNAFPDSLPKHLVQRTLLSLADPQRANPLPQAAPASRKPGPLTDARPEPYDAV